MGYSSKAVTQFDCLYTYTQVHSYVDVYGNYNTLGTQMTLSHYHKHIGMFHMNTANSP